VTDKINTSTNEARWHTAWKNRIKNNKPNEGDYNFVLWKRGSEVVYQPPEDGSEPSVFVNGEWVRLISPQEGSE
jgi:hypothetical protein